MSPLEKACEGALIGCGVVTTITPLLYAKNMAQTNRPFIARHCFRGVAENAISVIPTTAAAFLTKEVTSEYFDPTTSSFIAGGVSGLVGTAPEAIVQEKQLPTTKTTTYRLLLNAKGRCFRGLSVVVMREGIYAPSYMVISPLVNSKLSQISNQWLKLGVSSVIVGSSVGVITTPLDTLRAAKQDNLLTTRTAKSYEELVRQLSVKGLFRGVATRSVACSAAIFLMQFGQNLLGE